MQVTINYLELSSRDISASKAFFASAFGWGMVDYGPGYSAFENAGLDGGIEQATAEPTPPLAVLHTGDLDAAEAAVIAAGGEVVVPQFDFPGGRRFHFREPGGNVLAVWSEPKP